MPLPYNETDDEVVQIYRRVHANSEQTHVAVLSAGERYYVAVAYDVTPADMMPLAAECVAFDPTLSGAVERARRWMEQHPKGVLGDESDGSGNRIVSSLVDGLRKVNGYGNQQMEQIDQQQGGQH